ncbi:hypothetical protein LWI29_003292 [Acer saccharum]|uniref:Uncharacterized protein n=1 Tax=Acer saccharum TaxID=4024 RepID=A0AA39RT65_ACESA|nr:hypothetical protein LWI29_003292 [Acer saccharum]
MLSLCPLVSRLSLATRTSATRILKGKTIPALANSGVQANRVIVTRTFSVKSDLEGDDGSGGSKNKENNASIPPFFHAVSFPDFLNDSREDFDISILWFHTNKEKNAFLGGRHGEMVPIKVNSQILEVPSGILPCYIKESDKEEMYRLHMEDQETQTPEKLAKDFNTAAETVDAILLVRDALKNGNKLTGTKIVEMYQLYKENPEIYTIERLAKDFGVAKGSAHLALFSAHVRHNPPWLKSSTSQGQEIHRLPVPRSVKADWDRLNTADSNSIAEAKRLSIANMLSLCPLVSRLSLATRTSATRILKGKTIPALANSGVQANRVIVTCTFSVKSDLEGDDGSGGSKNKENNASIPQFFHAVSFPDFLNDSREDFDISILWFHTNKEKNAFLGGRHGEMVPIKVNSQILEVPSGILPCYIKESDKEEMYRLHMEDQETQTPEKLAKDFNTAVETVDAILLVRDALKNGNKLTGTKIVEMYQLYKENPEIYTIERLAKDFGVAKGSAHLALFSAHMRHNPPWLKSSTSQGQEIHRLPVPRSVKADWDRLNTADSNSIAEAKRLGMQIKNRYKKMLPPESSDHDVFKLRMSRVCLADEFNEMDENLKCPKP